MDSNVGSIVRFDGDEERRKMVLLNVGGICTLVGIRQSR